MDHKVFEDAMFEAVNRNAADMEAAQQEALVERQMNEAAHKARMLRIRKKAACKEILGTGIVFLGITGAMFWLSWAGSCGELPELICGVAGLAAGSRITALARVFRKK